MQKTKIISVQVAYLALHGSVLLFGMTAIFGKLLSDYGFNSNVIVWWRLFFAVLLYSLVPGVVSKCRKLPRAQIKKIMLVGCIVGLHWLLFYASIALSNASVGAICISTLSLFTALFEPFMHKKRVSFTDLGFGLMVIPGILLVLQFLPDHYYLGFFVGLVSAALSAIFSSYNRLIILEGIDSITVTYLEMLSAFILVSLILPFLFGFVPNLKFALNFNEVFIFICFAVFSTLLPFFLNVICYQQISAFASNLAFSLEPVYSIIIAIYLFDEHLQLGAGFYLGLAIIISTVIFYPIVIKYMKKKELKNTK